MTPRQRVLSALNHHSPDKVPYAAICGGLNPPAAEALAAFLHKDVAAVYRLFYEPFDIRGVGPAYIGPPERNTSRPDGAAVDIWGVARKNVCYGAGTYSEICDYPLAGTGDVSELDNYPWPSPDWFDYSVIPAQIEAIRRQGDYAVIASCGNMFETAWAMRGFENMLGDFIAEPEIASEILRRITDFYCEYSRRLLEASHGEVDLAFTADDIAHQTGLIISPELWEKMLKPCHAKLNKVIHSFGIKVVYHSDGAVMDAIPGLIDMGIDALQALQFDAAKMDAAEMKRLYGDRLSFCGGVSVQSTLPFGTPEDVEREVRYLIDTLGEGGGFILGPSHAIQAGTPPENVVAMLRAAGRYDESLL